MGLSVLFMAGELVWSAGHRGELLAPGLERRIFWDNVQCLGFDALAAGGLLFALDYSGRHPVIRRWGWLLALLPLLTLLISWSGRFPGLLRVNPELNAAGAFLILAYQPGIRNLHRSARYRDRCRSRNARTHFSVVLTHTRCQMLARSTLLPVWMPT